MTETLHINEAPATSHGWRNSFIIINALIILGVIFWIGMGAGAASDVANSCWSDPSTTVDTCETVAAGAHIGQGIATVVMLSVGGAFIVAVNIILGVAHSIFRN